MDLMEVSDHNEEEGAALPLFVPARRPFGSAWSGPELHLRHTYIMFSCTHFLVLLSFRPVFASGPCRGIGTPLCQDGACPRSFWRGVTRRTSASSSTSSSVCLAGPCFLRVVERTFPRRGHRHRQTFFSTVNHLRDKKHFLKVNHLREHSARAMLFGENIVMCLDLVEMF